jgi:hypothetical protein
METFLNNFKILVVPISGIIFIVAIIIIEKKSPWKLSSISSYIRLIGLIIALLLILWILITGK